MQTKVALVLQICISPKAILGVVHPNKFISTKVFMKEDIADNVNPTSDIEMAHEAKIAALTFQDLLLGKYHINYCVVNHISSMSTQTSIDQLLMHVKNFVGINTTLTC